MDCDQSMGWVCEYSRVGLLSLFWFAQFHSLRRAQFHTALLWVPTSSWLCQEVPVALYRPRCKCVGFVCDFLVYWIYLWWFVFAMKSLPNWLWTPLGESCLGRTRVGLELLAAWYGTCCVLHKPLPLETVRMGLSRPIRVSPTRMCAGHA